MIFGQLEDGRRRPEEALRLRGRLDGGRIVAGKEARLQLADPVQAGGIAKTRLARQAAARTDRSSNPSSSKQPKFRRQTAERPDQRELRGDEVDDETEPRPSREFEPVLGLALHLGERIAAREKVREQVVAAKRRIGEVAGLLRDFEGATQRAAARPDMPRPWH